jgi:hypothetical protein
MKKIIIAIALILLIGAGYYTIQNIKPFDCCHGEQYEISQWKTYRNNDYGFTFKYPKDYEDFKDGTAISKVVVNENTYPTIHFQIFPLNTYKFSDIPGGFEMTYNPKTKECLWGNRGSNDKSADKNKYTIAGNPACKIGTGDAGFSASGYAIPDEKNNRIIEINFISRDGQYRELNENLLISTFQFISTAPATDN